MALRDLGAFLEDDGLEYPVPATAFTVAAGAEHPHPDGKTYRVPSVDAKTGLWLTALADLGARASAGVELDPADSARLRLDDDDEKTLYQRVLGPAYDEMLADGVKWTTLQKIGQDAYIVFSMGEQVADGVLPGNQPARPNRASRRAAKTTAGRKSRRASTGSATPTRPQASSGSSTSPTAPEAAAAI